VESDFAVHLRVDLRDVMHTRSWRWFELRVAALLATPGTFLHSFFRPTNDQTEVPDGG